jgi:hypothetical protein
MAHLELSVLVDGIKSIGTHNNVHRIECYRLTAENKPEPAVELIIPAASLPGFIAALARISAGTAMQTPPAVGAAAGAAPARADRAAAAQRPKRDTTPSQ